MQTIDIELRRAFDNTTSDWLAELTTTRREVDGDEISVSFTNGGIGPNIDTGLTFSGTGSLDRKNLPKGNSSFDTISYRADGRLVFEIEGLDLGRGDVRKVFRDLERNNPERKQDGFQKFLDREFEIDLEASRGNDGFQGTRNRDTLEGGNGRDTLLGGKRGDTIDGENGNDRLFGESGRDTVEGGDGRDRIDGGGGPDTLDGDDGNDRLFGRGNDDFMLGGPGDDVLKGNGGDDRMNGEEGDDRLIAGRGDDAIIDFNGASRAKGGAGDDTIRTGDENDRINGGAGDDLIQGGAGRDTITGGAGNDQFYFGATELRDLDGDRTKIVTDFTIGEDKIAVIGAEGFDDITIAEAGRGARVSWGEYTEVLLRGVDAASLSEDDFLFF